MLMKSDLYSEDELKRAHKIVLSKESKKTPDLFFCNEILRLYNDEELLEGSGLRENGDFYQIMFNSFIQQ